MSFGTQTNEISPTGFEKSLAVVIGIDRYSRGVPELRTAVADARRLGEMLESDHGYEVRAFLDEDASQEALLALFQTELHEALGPEDRLIFYFAGHGVASDGDDGPNGYLLPCDAKAGDLSTYLHMPGIHDELLKLECRHVLVILDSCFSGAFKWSGTRSVPDVPKVIHKERFDRFLSDPAWQVISSASHDQKALDQLIVGTLGSRDESGEAHSPFAQVLFDGLAGAGDVTRGGRGDGVVTATELYLHLEEHVHPGTTKVGKRQKPAFWPLRKHDKGEFIFLVPGHELNLPPAPELNLDNNPYRGLESYDIEHADLFFGRKEEIEKLLKRVHSNPLTVVVGASGTGKSSLVKAGVLPKLLGKDSWHVLPVVRPAKNPGSALLKAVGSLEGSMASEPTDSLQGNLDSARTVLEDWLDRNDDGRVVLVIDQLEELVTLAPGVGTRDGVMSWIGETLKRAGDRVRVVLTVRSDFEPSFRDSVPGQPWEECQYPVPVLDLDDYRAVIEGPASYAVMYFDDPRLVDQLIEQVNQTPGALPLLSFTLSEMYRRYVERKSGDRALTREDYDGLGGVIGALQTRADEEYERVEDDKEAMRLLMLRMVAWDRGALSRRRVEESELNYADDELNRRLVAVRERLTEARLLVEGKDERGRRYVEPAHDALVNAWKQLKEWRDEADADELANLAFRRRLTSAAAEWDETQDSKAHKGLLWRDAARASVLRRISRKKTRARWLNRRELEFARRSIRRSRVLQWTRNVAVTVIAVLGAVAVVWGRSAVQSATEAKGNATAMIGMDLAEAAGPLAQVVGDTLLNTSRLLAVEAYRTSDNTETFNALFQAIQGVPTQVLLDPSAGPDVASLDDPVVTTVDEGLLASLTEYLGRDPETSVHAWGGGGFAFAVYDSVWVLRPWGSGDAGGVGVEFARGTDVGAISALALSPDRRLVAVAGDIGLQVFDGWSQQAASEVNADAAGITELRFRQGGRSLVATVPDGTVWQFDIKGGLNYATAATRVPATKVAFSGDREAITFTSRAAREARGPGRLALWDASAGSQQTLVEVQSGLADVASVNAVYWAGGELAYLSVADEGEQGSIDVLGMLELSEPDLRWEPAMVVAEATGALAAVLLLESSTGSGRSAQAGARLVVATLGPSPTLTAVVDLPERPAHVSFSDDGRYLLTTGRSGTLGFAGWWEVNAADGSLAEYVRVDFDAPITAAHAGWNGEAAFAEDDGTIQLWELGADVPWYDHPLRIELNVGPGVTSLALDASGEFLAVARESHVRVWSTDIEQPFGDPIDVKAPVHSVAFDAGSGDLLAGGGADGGFFALWNFDPQQLVGEICRVVDRNLSRAEGYRYLTWEELRQYRCTCDGAPPEGVQALGLEACPDRYRLADWLMGRATFGDLR